jgi:multiple antibiotic resistance protein
MPFAPVLKLFLYDLVALLVIIDPAGTAMAFIAMTPRETAQQRAQLAVRACAIAFAVLALFGLAGEELLLALGIGLPAMKVAGGVLLFLTAADMVTARGALRTSHQEREEAARSSEDISVFPLAIPLIAGPGAMTTMVLLHSQAHGGVAAIAAIQVALVLAIAATLVTLLAARHVVRLLGQTGSNVIGRVFGVLLAALAAQIALDGVREALNLH